MKPGDEYVKAAQIIKRGDKAIALERLRRADLEIQHCEHEVTRLKREQDGIMERMGAAMMEDPTPKLDLLVNNLAADYVTREREMLEHSRRHHRARGDRENAENYLCGLALQDKPWAAALPPPMKRRRNWMKAAARYVHREMKAQPTWYEVFAYTTLLAQIWYWSFRWLGH